jgi:molybdate transport system substrate-binding protein
VKARYWLLLVLLLGMSSSLHAQSRQTLVVFAAASLTDAFEDIATQFEAQYNVEILFNFASSSDLAAQLADGAPADVFASANNTHMNSVINTGRIAGSPQIFAQNHLMLIVPFDNPADISSLADLANAGVKVVVAADGVPVRDYTNTMFDRLAADAAYGEDYRMAVSANIVSEEQNVRQVAAKVALGEADAGIVYISDVTPDIADAVLALPIADELNTIATYPIAVTNDSAQPELAQAFVDFVLSDAGQDTLVKWNFVSIRTAQTSPLPEVNTQPYLSIMRQIPIHNLCVLCDFVVESLFSIHILLSGIE